MLHLVQHYGNIIVRKQKGDIKMKKFIFKDHVNPNITKEVIGFDYSMLPSGSYKVNAGCFNKVIINCRDFYLAKVEAL